MKIIGRQRIPGFALAVAALVPCWAQAQSNFTIGTPANTTTTIYARSGNDAWPSGSTLAASTVVVASNLSTGRVRNVVPNPAADLNDPALDDSAIGIRTSGGYSVYVRNKANNGRGGTDIMRYRHSDGDRRRIDQDPGVAPGPYLETLPTVAVNASGGMWLGALEGVYAWSNNGGNWWTIVRDFTNGGGNTIDLTEVVGVDILYPTCHTWGCTSMASGGGLFVSKVGDTAADMNGELYPFMGRDEVVYHRLVGGVPAVFVRALDGSTSPPTIGGETPLPTPLDDDGETEWCEWGYRNVVLGDSPYAASNEIYSDLVAFLGEGCKDPVTGLHNRSRLYLYSAYSGNMWELPDDMSQIDTTESSPPQYRFDSGYVDAGGFQIPAVRLYVIFNNSGDDDVKAYNLPSSF